MSASSVGRSPCNERASNLEDLPGEICDGYYRHYFEGVGFLPGAERLLDVASHFENCLITNGEHGKQWGKIRKMGVDSRLDHILVSEDLGVWKPDPRIFERALELTGARPSESVMIGDSLHADIAGAGPTGIGTIWINQYGYSLDEATHEPDEMVTNPGEAASLIEQLTPMTSTLIANVTIHDGKPEIGPVGRRRSDSRWPHPVCR